MTSESLSVHLLPPSELETCFFVYSKFNWNKYTYRLFG